jgi:hypothetical protein
VKELREMFRYVDRVGLPSKVWADMDTRTEAEEAVLVPIPSRLLRILRAAAEADGAHAFNSTAVVVAELAREREQMRVVAARLDEILKLAHKHEAQYWLDAPGTDAERLARIVKIGRNALAEAKGL